jgi:hypothetical protein
VSDGSIGGKPMQGTGHGQNRVLTVEWTHLEVGPKGISDHRRSRATFSGGKLADPSVEFLVEVDLCAAHRCTIRRWRSDVYAAAARY